MLDRSGSPDNWALRILDPLAFAVACLMLVGGFIDLANAPDPVKALIGVAVGLLILVDLGRRRRPWTYFRQRAK